MLYCTNARSKQVHLLALLVIARCRCLKVGNTGAQHVAAQRQLHNCAFFVLQHLLQLAPLSLQASHLHLPPVVL